MPFTKRFEMQAGLCDFRLCRCPQIQRYIRGQLAKFTDTFLKDAIFRLSIGARRMNQLSDISWRQFKPDVCGDSYIQILFSNARFVVSIITKPAGEVELATLCVDNKFPNTRTSLRR
jgi:hypothetical protein